MLDSLLCFGYAEGDGLHLIGAFFIHNVLVPRRQRATTRRREGDTEFEV